MNDYSFVENVDELQHYGMPRRSGRYPWGSGKDPYQHAKDFLTYIDNLKSKGWKETPENIKEEFGLSVREYKWEKSICLHDRRSQQVSQVENMKKDGLSTSDIAKKLGKNESSIRSLLDAKPKARMKELDDTIKFLKERMDNDGYDMLDIGKDTERELRVSRDRLDAAAYYLTSREGYHVYSGGIKQPTNVNQQTTQMVLAKPDVQWKDIYKYDKIGTLIDYSSSDDGHTFQKMHYPESMDSKRLKIRYADQGGISKDGLIELRPGVEDLSLSGAKYSQVRILVDGTHYMKGMAVYGDPKDFPPGVDVIFNTNKMSGKPMQDVLKGIKTDDPVNPFGSAIKPNGQYWYTDKNGNKKLGLVNKRADEGDWEEWADAVPSQFLSKQPVPLAKKQLNIAKENKKAEYDEIMSLTNPTLRKHLLEKFASQCDSDAVTLKAAAFPGQKYHVIIPINSLKDTEVYAPRYNDGDKLALVRYPHGGIFEIPVLTVNNKNREGSKYIGKDAEDALGITKRVADQLSGADFDGDTVMTIPLSGSLNIRSKPYLKELEGFDGKLEYPHIPGAPVMSKHNMQIHMGKVTNLITDMTLYGAPDEEIARATKHSMVIVDSYKHKLNYKQSEIDNNIDELKRKYQIKLDENGNPTEKYGGSATLISRAKSPVNVPKRKGEGRINLKDKPWYDPDKPEGALVFKTAPESERIYQKAKVLKSGKIKIETRERVTESTAMAETNDARTLMSANKWPMEEVYADYANYMKSLANNARLSMVKTPRLAVNKKAKEEYASEVESLMDKLNTAALNAPKERAALRKANIEISQIESSGKLEKEEKRKLSQRAVTSARAEVGSTSRKERNIKITDREWEAIQSGAISENKLVQILANADIDDLRNRAMPKTSIELSSAKQGKIKALQASGKTIKQIADALNISASTVTKYLK